MHNSASSFAYSKGGGQPPPLTKTSQLATAAFCVCVEILRKLTIQLEPPSGAKQTTSPVCGNIYIHTYVHILYEYVRSRNLCRVSRYLYNVIDL